MVLEQLLTPRRVAELEGCSLTTVYKRLTDGEYTAVKVPLDRRPALGPEGDSLDDLQ